MHRNIHEERPLREFYWVQIPHNPQGFSDLPEKKERFVLEVQESLLIVILFAICERIAVMSLSKTEF